MLYSLVSICYDQLSAVTCEWLRYITLSVHDTFWRRELSTTMATHGSMKTFNPQLDDWTTYEERLKHYLIANDVADADKKRSILQTVCGAPTYKLLRSLSGGSQDTKSYDDLAALLKTHFNPN